jgi:oxygen-independent coproporphyrinogen-3 oxidase
VGSDFFSLSTVKQLSLYIHVPFCTHKCAYCDFFSTDAADNATIETIISETLLQTEYFLQLLNPQEVVSVYIGGGTPGSIACEQFRTLLRNLSALGARPTREYTVEANPETLDEEFLKICDTAGVTRLSLGIQSFHHTLRSAIGRTVSDRDIDRALRLVEKKWHGELNLDILTGLPGETLRQAQSDITRALSYAPSHVSCYTLTVEPGTGLDTQVKRGAVLLPAGGEQDRLWFAAGKMLTLAGYNHYEISNFAQPGRESVHNLRYWLLEPYLGVGPAAVSTLPGKDHGVVRINNPRDLQAFLRGKTSFWGVTQETIHPDELLFEQLMLGFRLEHGIPAALFQKRFGRPLPELLPRLWDSWCGRGLVGKRPGAYCLTLRGRLILNRLLRELSMDGPGPEEINATWP